MGRWVWVGPLVLVAACAAPRSGAPPAGPRAGAVQEGIASWYGPGFHGNSTASGEVYDQNDLTAAHQTLPLGTRVAVTNLENGSTIELRINDRGPFVKNRILDLSHAAARSLGVVGPGTAPVRIEVLGPNPVFMAVAYAVQVGAFTDRGNAERLRAKLVDRFGNVYVSPYAGEAGHYYRVRIGRFSARDEAVMQASEVSGLGLPAVIVEDGSVPFRNRGHP